MILKKKQAASIPVSPRYHGLLTKLVYCPDLIISGNSTSGGAQHECMVVVLLLRMAV